MKSHREASPSPKPVLQQTQGSECPDFWPSETQITLKGTSKLTNLQGSDPLGVLANGRGRITTQL